MKKIYVTLTEKKSFRDAQGLDLIRSRWRITVGAGVGGWRLSGLKIPDSDIFSNIAYFAYFSTQKESVYHGLPHIGLLSALRNHNLLFYPYKNFFPEAFKSKHSLFTSRVSFYPLLSDLRPNNVLLQSFL